MNAEWITLLAASATSDTKSDTGAFSIMDIVQFGLLGLFFLCLVFRKYIVPEWVLKQVEEAHEKELAERDEREREYKIQIQQLQADFRSEIIPALVRSTEINAKYNEEIQRQRFAADHGGA